MNDTIPAGDWPCTVLIAAFGLSDKQTPRVRVSVRIDDGPSKGRTVTYEDDVTNKSAIYVARSAKAVGWEGGDLQSLAADVAKWIAATGGKTTVEIKHIEIRNGKRAGQIWDKANSLGRGTKPLTVATGSTLADANAAMQAALRDLGSADVPPPSDDDLPFASCELGAEPSAIARVLRGAL